MSILDQGLMLQVWRSHYKKRNHSANRWLHLLELCKTGHLILEIQVSKATQDLAIINFRYLLNIQVLNSLFLNQHHEEWKITFLVILHSQHRVHTILETSTASESKCFREDLQTMCLSFHVLSKRRFWIISSHSLSSKECQIQNNKSTLLTLAQVRIHSKTPLQLKTFQKAI